MLLAHGVLEVRSTDRHQIVVHVAEETLRTRKAGCCEIEDGPSIAAETARCLSCDASVVAIIETKPGNLALLCQFHHRAVHESGIRIEMLDDGALRFVKPNGKSVDNVAAARRQSFDEVAR